MMTLRSHIFNLFEVSAIKERTFPKTGMWNHSTIWANNRQCALHARTIANFLVKHYWHVLFQIHQQFLFIFFIAQMKPGECKHMSCLELQVPSKLTNTIFQCGNKCFPKCRNLAFWIQNSKYLPKVRVNCKGHMSEEYQKHC